MLPSSTSVTLPGLVAAPFASEEQLELSRYVGRHLRIGMQRFVQALLELASSGIALSE
jgi:hypothetical protein